MEGTLIPQLPYLTITYHDAFKINSTVVHEKPYPPNLIIHLLHNHKIQGRRRLFPFCKRSSPFLTGYTTIDNLASPARVFRGDRISSLPTNTISPKNACGGGYW